MNKEQTELERKVIDFYCKKCKKTLKVGYVNSGNPDAKVLERIIMRCHTNKCTRVMTFKNMTEKEILTKVDKFNRIYI